MRNAQVQQAVSERQKKLADKLEITQECVVAELAKIGFSDIRRSVSWKPNVTAMVEDPDTGEQRMAITNEVALIGSEDIDDDTAATISEISQSGKGGLRPSSTTRGARSSISASTTDVPCARERDVAFSGSEARIIKPRRTLRF